MRALVVVVAAIAILGARPALAQVLGPGLEEEVSALVWSAGEPAELASRIEVVGAQIEARDIEVMIGGPNGRARVRLVARGTSSDGYYLGHTASFDVWLIDRTGEPEMIEAARALMERIRRRDRGGFWRHAAALPPVEPAPPAIAPELGWIRGALWAGLLSGLAIVVVLARRQGQVPRSSDVVFAAGLFGLSLLLRLATPPWAPLHANEHHIAEMRGLLGDPSGAEAWLYGSAYLEVVRVLLAPLGGWIDGPLVLSAVFGALGPPLLFALSRAVAPSWGSAWLPALALMVHPAHVRLSLAETPKPLAMSLFLLGCALAALAFRRQVSAVLREVAFVTAALAWSIALQLHVLTLLLPIAGSLLVLVAVGRLDRAPRWSAVIGIALVGLAAALHVQLELGAARGEVERLALLDVLGRAFSSRALTSIHRLAGPLVVPLAAIGAFSGARHGGARLALGSLLAFAALFPPSLLVNACLSDAIRYQTEAHLPLLVLLVMVPRARASMDLALVGLVVGSGALASLALSAPDASAQAYAIARRAPPPPTPILVGAPRMESNPQVLSNFPDFAIESPGRVVREPAPGCVVWIGVPCWSFGPEERGVELEADTPMRRECVELLGGIERARALLDRLVPIEVPHRDEEFHRIDARAPRVGFAPCRTEM